MNPIQPTRRTILHGMGACMALPWFETLAPRRAEPAPQRLCILVMPNGVLPSAWDPRSDGEGGWQPSFALEPLANRRQEVNVFRHLANRRSFDGDGHYAKVAPLLTGRKIRRTGGRELWNGVSMDQVAARAVGSQTLLPSLELGCDPIYPVEDMGYSTLYGGHIAWAAPDRPMPKEIVPQRAFDRLFRATALAADPARASVLDVVRGEARALAPRLSMRDRRTLDEYESAVRDLERRIALAARDGAAARLDGATAVPGGVPSDYPTHVALMFDLIELAFASDATRVVTFLMANEVSGRSFPFVEGCGGGFHEYSHHEGRRDKQEPYRKINRWHVEQFGKLLDRLAARREGAASLLDRSHVVLASAMKDGNEHSPHDLPVLLAGGGDGTLPQGRLVESAPDTPLCGLWLAILQRMGVATGSFGDADRPLF
ncbi:MAG: hypothetical protein RL398_1646 [Planctomycetota bacterium]